MHATQLSIKPPKTEWSPLATIGSMACFGAFLGTIKPPNSRLALFALCATVFFSCASISIHNDTQRKIKKHLLYVSVLFLFYALSTLIHNKNKPPWVTGLDGEPTTLFCLATTDSIHQTQKIGPMSEFDYKDGFTYFTSEATPNRHRSQPLDTAEIKIVCGGTINIQKGDLIKCTGWLKNYPKTTQPTTLFVSRPRAIQIQTKAGWSLIKKIKTAIRKRTLSNLSEEKKTLAGALFFGVHGSNWSDIYPKFKKSGMSHILAISGMHVSIMVLFATALLSVIVKTKPPKILFVLLFLFFIFQIVEQKPPITRALIMIIALLFSRVIAMRCYTVSFLAISATLILLVDPSESGNTGFQLSFIVVASLCVLLPKIKWRTLGPVDVNAKTSRMAKRWAQTTWLTGMCAWLISFPILIHTFGTIAPIGIISNIPSTLLLLTTLCVGITKTIIENTTLSMGGFFGSAFSELLFVFLITASWLGDLPWAYFEGIHIGWTNATLLFVAVCVWAMKTTKRAAVWAFVISANCFVFVSVVPHNQTTIITTIDVGHGTCHVIQNNDHAILIDCGSRNNFDVGNNTIKPILRKLRITKIDTIIITHSDIDHISGIIDIANTYKIKKVIIAPQTIANKTKPMQKLLKHIIAMGIKIKITSAGWQENTKNTTIKIISPSKLDPHRSPNATSIVLLLSTHGRRVLFTGDIDEQKINEISKKIQDDVHVIELPHHGQWSQESQNFINKYTPHAVIQSTNLARHSKDRWLIPSNTNRFTTAVDGTITTTIKQDGTLSIVGSAHPATMPICLLPP